jgi:hypothetical protein
VGELKPGQRRDQQQAHGPRAGLLAVIHRAEMGDRQQQGAENRKPDEQQGDGGHCAYSCREDLRPETPEHSFMATATARFTPGRRAGIR